jgi:hypothetical protein
MVTTENRLGPFGPVIGTTFEFFQVEIERFCHGFFPGAESNPASERIQAPRQPHTQELLGTPFTPKLKRKLR